jgi:hypothetical protein
MATRGTYTFKDDSHVIRIYKHWDNYPSTALKFIEKALEYAWELPRFEADEFAASFVAANKSKDGGDIRLGDVPAGHREEYNYEITLKNNELYIVCTDIVGEEQFSGSLNTCQKMFELQEAARLIKAA